MLPTEIIVDVWLNAGLAGFYQGFPEVRTKVSGLSDEIIFFLFK